ncbi:MAG: hypothetical protein ACAF41_16295 [Leptolyngbya sp. BL-A-14]
MGDASEETRGRRRSFIGVQAAYTTLLKANRFSEAREMEPISLNPERFHR